MTLKSGDTESAKIAVGRNAGYQAGNQPAGGRPPGETHMAMPEREPDVGVTGGAIDDRQRIGGARPASHPLAHPGVDLPQTRQDAPGIEPELLGPPPVLGGIEAGEFISSRNPQPDIHG